MISPAGWTRFHRRHSLRSGPSWGCLATPRVPLQWSVGVRPRWVTCDLDGPPGDRARTVCAASHRSSGSRCAFGPGRAHSRSDRPSCRCLANSRLRPAGREGVSRGADGASVRRPRVHGCGDTPGPWVDAEVVVVTTSDRPERRTPDLPPPDRADPARWNAAMNRILRESAEVREQLEQARATEDSRLARRQAAALLALIDAHTRLPEEGPIARTTRARRRSRRSRAQR
jgi:hypothetical protein